MVTFLQIAAINQGLADKAKNFFNLGAIKVALVWLFGAILVISVAAFLILRHYDKKKYNKKVVAHSIIHGHFYPTYRDLAKSVKLGKGGFEVIYLKKMKAWKLAHGARIGINEYHFYILPDGYWYPGQVSADLLQMDKMGGLIPVVTTNPTMRSQYTALEKQIDLLHGQKQNFWDKYGNWVLSIGFVVIMGLFTWLSYKEIGGFLGSGSALADRMTELAEVMNKLAVNLNNAQPNGLVPAQLIGSLLKGLII